MLALIGDRSVDEGSLLTFTASASDADLPANTLTFSLDAGAPTGATIDPNTGLFNWTPGESAGPGVYPVTVRVTDNGVPRLDDFETFNITVSEVNQAPVLAAIGNQNVLEGNTLTFTASATDPDLPSNTLSYSLDAGAPAGATIDPVSGVFSWTPGETTGPGTYQVTVRVTDDGTPSLDDFETFDITVDELNQAPVLNPIGNLGIDEGDTLTFTASATDADVPANSLTFSLDAGAPSGASINPSSGVFSWTPDEAAGPGLYTVTVRVTDDGTPNLNDFETIQITVSELNQAPVLNPIGNQSVNENNTLMFTASATDADLPANTLTFSLDAGAPVGAAIDAVTGLFSWTPDETAGPGSYPVTVRVTDDGAPNLDDFETFEITVFEVNQAPVLTAIGDQSVNEGSTLTFTASATDPDSPANTLTFSLDPGAPSGATIDPVSGLFSWTPDETAGPGTFPLVVRVSDDASVSLDDFEFVNITVHEVNEAPVLNPISDKTVDPNELLSFNVTASDSDLPANTLTYSLDAASLAEGMTIDPITGQFSWTPNTLHALQSFTVNVTVTDDGMTSGSADPKSSTQSFQIDVTDFVAEPISIDVRVSASSDDAEERHTTSVKLTTSDLELTRDKNSVQTVGIRFNNLTIPQGATISNAYIQFQTDEVTTEATDLTIRAQAIDHAPTFTSVNANISSRATTLASTQWVPAPWNIRGEAGPSQRTPDISNVIQEVVNRQGWSSGNSAAIIVTGTGVRTAESFDGVPSAAPLLHIEYVPGGPQRPTTSGINDVNVLVNAANTEINLFDAFDDYEDPDDALTYSIVSNTNPSLFNSTTIGGNPRLLTLDYALDAEGTADITVRATDTTNESVETTFTVTVSQPGSTNLIMVQSRVSASSDDAEQRPSGSVVLGSSDLELTLDRTNQQVVGLRFTNLNIPAGASIQNAYVQFQTDEIESTATSLTIRGEAIDDAPTFTTASNNISSRATTTASVPWSPAAWSTIGEAGLNQQTPDLTNVIQEIIDRSGWADGNSLAVIITGTGKRTAESFDGIPSAAPLLVVDYVLTNSPRATNDTAITDPTTPVTTDVLANDYLAEEPTLITSVTDGSHGTVTYDASAGTTTYTPNGIFFGYDTYTYTITDSDGDKSIGTVGVTVGDGMHIRVIADVPYDAAEYAQLEADLASVDPNDAFYVHLGDIKDGSAACTESWYANAATSLKTSPIPVFIIPGDNEWNDCVDPNQAWTYWDTHLMGLENHWSHGFNVMRQTARPENFAFVHSDVLFMGFNLVGGTIIDPQLMADNVSWMNTNFSSFGNQVNSAVLFGHAFPNGGRQAFGDALVIEAQNFGKPVLYMMGDDHSWNLDNPFAAAPNITRVTVDQSVPSVRVSISDQLTYPFIFDRNPGPLAAPPPPDALLIVERKADLGLDVPIETFDTSDADATQLVDAPQVRPANTLTVPETLGTSAKAANKDSALLDDDLIQMLADDHLSMGR